MLIYYDCISKYLKARHIPIQNIIYDQQLKAISVTFLAQLAGRSGNVLLIQFNNPLKLNAYTIETYGQLRQVIQENQQYPFLMTCGIGRAYSSGADLQYILKLMKQNRSHEQFQQAYSFLNHFIQLKLPTISFINGIAMGGGGAKAIMSTLRIATEKSIFAMPEASIGLFPDIGAGYFLNHLNYQIGLFMALTGYRVIGADLVHIGLADYYLETAQYDQLVKELSNSSVTEVFQARSIIESLQRKKIPEFSLKDQIKTLEKLFNGDSLNQVYQNLENHDDKAYSNKLKSILSRQCPLSLRITFETLKRGKSLTIREVLINDYRVAYRLNLGQDFKEGVHRATKDKNYEPKWTFKNPLEIDQKIVDSYFAQLPGGELQI